LPIRKEDLAGWADGGAGPVATPTPEPQPTPIEAPEPVEGRIYMPRMTNEG